MWEIKGKNNVVKATVDTPEYNGEWMGERYVTVSVESPTPVNFEIGDYIIYRGERFEINYDPGKIKSAPQNAKGDAFRYENIKFNSLADELTRCDFLDVVLEDNQLHFTGLPKFPFYGNVKDLANRMQANLDRTYGKNTWHVVVSPEHTDRKELNISVDTIKVWGALEILVNQFETYYTIKGRTVTIGAAGIPAGHLFKYGKGNGLYEIEQSAEADQAIVTRLRAYGSTRNLPHRYYNSLTGADGQKLIPDNMAVQNLMLPSFPYTTQDPYIDSPNINKLGIREDTVFFDGSQEGLEEIYPSIEGMTAEQLKEAGEPCSATGALDEIVSAEQMTDNGVGKIEGDKSEAEPSTFKVTLKDLGFNLWEHRIAGTAPVMSFKSGKLGGRDFEIVGCKKEGDNYVLELNRVYDDGIKLWFPYKDYNAAAGDKFVLLHIEMPEVYIKAAAVRLKEAAEKWLSKNDYSRSIYAPKIDEIFMARQHDEAMASGGTIKSLHDTITEGMLLLFEDDDLNIDASVFIDRLTIKEGDGPIPTYEVVLKEKKTVGRLDKMQNQIDSLVAGSGQGGVGGYTAAQIRSMIEAYGGTRFLSKLKDDRSSGKIASDKGFEAGHYLAGASGGIFGIDHDTGDSFAEVARLYVRVKAFFEELTIIKAGVLAGKQYITPGGGIKCTKVEELESAYRCHFISGQDGEQTVCNFIAGDQAISEMFNAKPDTSNKVSNHRYWRLVTAVNNDAHVDESGNHYGYVDLSKTVCARDSDVPQAGDEICQLGNRNVNNPERRSAMVFSTVDPDSPSIKLFDGIVDFSLVNKAVVVFGCDPITGKVYFRLGKSDAAQYLDYTQSGGLVVAGSISSQSTVGDKTIGEYVRDEAPYVIVVDNQVLPVFCDKDEEPVDTLPNFQVKIMHGTQDDTANWFVDVDTDSLVACEVLNEGDGMFSVEDMYSHEASCEIVAVKDGAEPLRIKITLYKVIPGADGAPGAPARVYSIEPSVDNVTLDFTGALSDTVVSCSKYETTGSSARTPSAANALVAIRYQNGVSTGAQVIAGPGNLSGSMTIYNDTTAVEFRLYKDAYPGDGTVLAVRRVPVLRDTKGMEPSGPNMLVNSAFLNGRAGWLFTGNTDVAEPSMSCDGVLSVKLSENGLTESMWRGFRQQYNPSDGTNTQLIIPGGSNWIAFSIYAYKRPNINFDDGAWMEVYFKDAAGERIAGTTRSVSVVPPTAGKWTRKSLTTRIPSGAHSVVYNVYLGKNGELFAAKPQLHFGNTLPEWAPSSLDFSYIAEALKGVTTIDGGLVLTSLIRLGYYLNDVFKVRSGVGGLQSDNPEQDVAFWAGGDITDAQSGNAGVVIRMGGTATFAGGVIEFTGSQLIVHSPTGSRAVLDSSGIQLIGSDGATRVRMQDTPLPAEADLLDIKTLNVEWNSKALSVPYIMRNGYWGGATWYPQTLTLYDSNVVSTKTFEVTNGSTLSGTVRVVVTKEWTESSRRIYGSAYLELWRGDAKVRTWGGAMQGSAEGRHYCVMIVNEPLSAGVYHLRLQVVGGTPPSPHGTCSGTVDLSSLTATRGFANQILLGNDGQLVASGTTAWCVKEDGCFTRAGGYGLKISASAGIQKWDNSSKKWVTANI